MKAVLTAPSLVQMSAGDTSDAPDSRHRGQPAARPLSGGQLRGPAQAAPARVRHRSRCSARSGTWAARRPRSTSSCATSAGRCRARCGAPTSRSSSSDREALADGAQIVVGGGTDYYEGSRTSSPSFTFLVRDLRVAGEGDLLAQLARLRKQLDSEGLFDPQKRLPRPALPRTIGVVTGQTGKARDDVLAGLARRGWQGRRGVGVRAGAGPPRRPGHHPRAPGPGRHGRGGHDRGGARRRLAGRHVRLLRRDAVPHGRAAAGAGDLVRGPPHRPHADRRRVRGLLLDPHPRGRAGGADPLRRGPHPAGPLRRPPARRRPAHRGPARPPPGRADPRPGRAPGPRAPPPAPAAARAARRGLAPHRRRAPRHAHPADGAGAQGRGRRRAPTRPAAARTWSACAWRWPPTTPSAPSSAATRWSPPATSW